MIQLKQREGGLYLTRAKNMPGKGLEFRFNNQVEIGILAIEMRPLRG